MVIKRHLKYFGIIAISKGFITLEQFTEAIKVQAKEDMAKQDHRLIGEILVGLGFMDKSQVNEVAFLKWKGTDAYQCPRCGIMIFNCPNCGTEISKA